MSSPNSSTPRTEKLKGLALSSSSSSTPLVVMEKAPMNAYRKLRTPPEVISERRIEIPTFGSSAAQRSGNILNLHPPKSYQIFTCDFCRKGFPSAQALGGHQNGHKQERAWLKKREEMEAEFLPPFFNPYPDNPNILFGGYSNDPLSNEYYPGITLDPFERLMYPSFNSGIIGGSAGMNMTAVPRVTPTSFFTGNNSTNYGSSSSRVPNLLPNNISPMSFIERNVFPSLPGTTELSGRMVSRENVLIEEDFISKIGTNNAVVIDDGDDGDDGDIDLSLSL